MLNPNYATAHHWYAEAYLTPTGHVDEALLEMRTAQTLDPLSTVITSDLGKELYFARHYDEAVIEFRRALELDPDFVSADNWLSDTFLEKGCTPKRLRNWRRPNHSKKIAFTSGKRRISTREWERKLRHEKSWLSPLNSRRRKKSVWEQSL